jgi:hypothetical protein
MFFIRLTVVILIWISILIGCSSISITVAEKCAIVKHSFYHITYWSDVKCMSEEEYRRAHESPPKVIYEELIDKD